LTCSCPKPSDGPSSGGFIGFVAYKAESRWAKGVVQQTEPVQSAK
jgi:hypothetical protein